MPLIASSLYLRARVLVFKYETGTDDRTTGKSSMSKQFGCSEERFLVSISPTVYLQIVVPVVRNYARVSAMETARRKAVTISDWTRNQFHSRLVPALVARSGDLGVPEEKYNKARRRRKILMFLYYFSFQKCVFKGIRASQKSEFSTKNCFWRVGKNSEWNSEIFALKFLAEKFQSLNSDIFRNSTLKFQSLTLKKKGLVGTAFAGLGNWKKSKLYIF